MRFDIEELLGDFHVTFVDGLWIALVALEAAIIVCVLGHRVLGSELENRKSENKRKNAFILAADSLDG